MINELQYKIKKTSRSWKMRLIKLSFFLIVFYSHTSSAYTFFKNFSAGTKEAFTDSNKYIWLTGSVFTLAAFVYDLDVYRHYEGRVQNKSINNIGDVFGTGLPGAGIALITMGSGWLLNSKKTIGAGVSHAEALFATFLYTSSLKIIVERDRPESFIVNESQESSLNASFPSGHTSTSFATAGSLMASAGPIVGVPVLVLAGLTGYSRIQQRVHFTGDVIFGATLGYTMGVGFYKKQSKGRFANLNILPYFENRESWGVTLNYKF